MKSAKYVSGFVSLILLICKMTFVYAQGPIKRPAETKKPTDPRVITAPGDSPARRLVNVPSVKGMFILDAEKAVFQAGLRSKTTYLAEPDSSVRRGHVSAVIPEVGSPVERDSEVELRVPRAASQMGKGNLSVADLERRMGFDLDTGRFEEMCSGADVLLLELDEWHDPGPSHPQSSQYMTSDLVLSATGGARIAPIDNPSITSSAGLGSLPVYSDCEDQLERGRMKQNLLEVFSLMDRLDIQNKAFCVFTSKKQMGVVDFVGSENLHVKAGGDYIFHWALFEREAPFRPDERPR